MATAVSRTNSNAKKPIAECRKAQQQFPLELNLRYRSWGLSSPLLSGEGKTVNISSSGVLFTCDKDFPVGTLLEISIFWPVPLHERHPLYLIGRGSVVRTSKGQVALEVQRFEFHLRNSIQRGIPQGPRT